MDETLIQKYRNLCQNFDKFYQIIDELNTFLLNNPASKKEEKKMQIEKIKVIDSKLYGAMMEDIKNGVF